MPSETTLRLTSDTGPIALAADFTAVDGQNGSVRARLSDAASIIEAVVKAFEAPVGLPPLSRCLTEDDRVSIAVGAGVPCLADVVRGFLEGLGTAGIEPGQVTLVTGDEADTAALSSGLSAALAEGLRVATHDPREDAELCFAGVDRHDRPLLINRQLFEADVVLPLACAHAAGHHDAHGAYGGLYPAFSDAEAIARIGRADASHSAKAHDGRDKETDHAGWLIGAPIAVHVAPGAAGSVAAIVAGEAQSAGRHATDLCRDLWTRRAAEPASLVIATLGADPDRQSWEDVGRALEAVSHVAADHGAVALATGLSTPPPRVIANLAEAEDFDAVQDRLERKQSPAAWLALQVAATLRRGPLYLMSRLEDDVVESLGLAPLHSTDELRRLASRHPSCVVLEDAEHVVASVGSIEAPCDA